MSDYKQSTSSLNGSIAVSTGSLTLNAVTAGSTLVAIILYNSLTDSYTSVSDNVNAGNYTKQITQSAGSPTAVSNTLYVAEKINSGSGNVTITFNFSVAKVVFWIVAEIGPCATSTPLDVTAVKAQTTSGTNPTGPSITTGFANEVILNILLSNGANYQAGTPPTGFTQRENVGPGNLVLATIGNAAAGTYGGVNWPCSGASDNYAMAILGFSPTNTGAGVDPFPAQRGPLARRVMRPLIIR